MLTENLPVIKTALGAVWDFMTANPLIVLGIVTSVAGIGFKFFSKAKKAAGGGK